MHMHKINCIHNVIGIICIYICVCVYILYQNNPLRYHNYLYMYIELIQCTVSPIITRMDNVHIPCITYSFLILCVVFFSSFEAHALTFPILCMKYLLWLSIKAACLFWYRLWFKAAKGLLIVLLTCLSLCNRYDWAKK